MNLSQIRVALDDAGVRPAKKLGQNFLHDQNLARWIVEQAQISRDDFVLEIGPGLGALTSEILKRGARLLALEKDARLANFLREKFRDPRFELHHGDALDFDQADSIRRTQRQIDWEPSVLHCEPAALSLRGFSKLYLISIVHVTR
jgi:Dimethyladenosine transferase (rRNA methylation)